MYRMIKFIFLLSIISFSHLAISQTVTVKKLSDKIKGESLDGYGTEVQGKTNDATNALTKILKEYGKIKLLSSDPIIVINPVLNGNLYETGILYATVKEANFKLTIWVGRKASDWNKSQIDTVDNEIKKLVYQTGVQFYRDQVQHEIDQTQQAIDAVDKQIVKFNNQGKDLVKNLSNNDLQKIKLEKALEANKLENAVLNVKIENNKKAQDSLASALTHIQQMKKVHEEKMRKIN
jgi:predicted RNase H-like nuclease (RuvC/YqgF family)